MEDVHACFHKLLPYFYIRRMIQSAITIKYLCTKENVSMEDAPDDSYEMKELKLLLRIVPLLESNYCEDCIPLYKATVEGLNKPNGVGLNPMPIFYK